MRYNFGKIVNILVVFDFDFLWICEKWCRAHDFSAFHIKAREIILVDANLIVF